MLRFRPDGHLSCPLRSLLCSVRDGNYVWLCAGASPYVYETLTRVNDIMEHRTFYHFAAGAGVFLHCLYVFFYYCYQFPWRPCICRSVLLYSFSILYKIQPSAHLSPSNFPKLPCAVVLSRFYSNQSWWSICRGYLLLWRETVCRPTALRKKLCPLIQSTGGAVLILYTKYM